MYLVPERIACSETTAYGKLIQERFEQLNLSKLILLVEDDSSVDFFVDFFGLKNYRDFFDGIGGAFKSELYKINSICESSGTINSIVLLGEFLGAISVVVENVNGCDGAVRYDGSTHYNQYYKRRSFRANVYGVSDKVTFKNKFNKLFDLTQPSSYYVEDIVFKE